MILATQENKFLNIYRVDTSRRHRHGIKIKKKLKQRENVCILTLETLTPKGLYQELY